MPQVLHLLNRLKLPLVIDLVAAGQPAAIGEAELLPQVFTWSPYRYLVVFEVLAYGGPGGTCERRNLVN